MPEPSRQTIARPATLEGVGLHTGTPSVLTLRPAAAGHGIVFERADLAGRPRVAASVDRVDAVDHRTALQAGEARVETVEHVLAAVAARQIDDLLIELDGPEPPILDGSAAPYFQALGEAGTVLVGGVPETVRVAAPLTVRDGAASYVVTPGSGLRLTVTIEWAHPVIGRQSRCVDITPEAFGAELARARTFGFVSERNALRARGLIRGASASNAIVLGDSGVEGTELRWPDEFVRHKAVDLLGDLSLLGARLDAEVIAFRPSHQGNVTLARALKRVAQGVRPAMSIEQILTVLPHRYPMLLVDRIIEVQGKDRIVGIKNVTINEPFFQGHFPDHPIMPGVLIIEAMAQVGGMLLMGQVDEPENKVVYFMSLDEVKFRRPVVPGDQIRFELEMLQFRGRTCKMRGVGYVDGQVAAEAEMMARVVDR